MRASYDEFIFAVRGEMNERRAQVVLEAFECMDKDKSGAIDSRDVKVSAAIILLSVECVVGDMCACSAVVETHHVESMSTAFSKFLCDDFFFVLCIRCFFLSAFVCLCLRVARFFARFGVFLCLFGDFFPIIGGALRICWVF